MSVRLMGQVWELDLNHPQQSVALALADHAHDDGTHIYPGISYLAWKTGYSERQVMRILEDLEAQRLINPVGGKSRGRGHKQEYWMNVSAVSKKPPFRETKRDKMSGFRSARKGDKMSGFRKGDNLSKGDISDDENVTFCALKGDISRRRIDSTRISTNHQLEPYVPNHKESTSLEIGTLSQNPAHANAKSSPASEPQQNYSKPQSNPQPNPQPNLRKPPPASGYPILQTPTGQQLVALCRRNARILTAKTAERLADVTEKLIETGLAEELPAFALRWPLYWHSTQNNGRAPEPYEVLDCWNEVMRLDPNAPQNSSGRRSKYDARNLSKS
jgi:hypothetical protein